MRGVGFLVYLGGKRCLVRLSRISVIMVGKVIGVGYRLSESDQESLEVLFLTWDTAMLMELERLIEEIVRSRRKSLTRRKEHSRSLLSNVV